MSGQTKRNTKTSPGVPSGLWTLEPGEFEVAVVERIRPVMQPIEPAPEDTKPPKCRERSTPPQCSGESKPPKCSEDTKPPQCRERSTPPICKGEATEDPHCA